MKKVVLSILFLFICSQAFGLDLTSTVVLDSGMSEVRPAASQIFGDIWVKYDDLDFLTADFDYSYGRDVSKINVAQIKFQIPETDIIIGRQQIGWGVGYTFNPIDIFNPKPVGSSFDPSFLRDGRDSVTVTRYFGEQNKVELIYAAQGSETKYSAGTKITTEVNADIGIKFKTNLMNSDMAISYIDKGARVYSAVPEAKDRVVGFELSGNMPMSDWGLWIESASYLDTNNYEYILGTDYYFDVYHFTLEYYRNGFGTSNKAVYDPALLLSGRLMGQDYIIPSFSATAGETLTLTAFNMWNMNDGSMGLGGVVDYFYTDNIEVIFMPFFIMGDPTSEYGQQQAVYGNYGVELMIRSVF